MIDRIEKLNALDSGMLVAGQQLLIPVRRAPHTDFVSRFDPGWRAGEDEGRGRLAPPLAAFLLVAAGASGPPGGRRPAAAAGTLRTPG